MKNSIYIPLLAAGLLAVSCEKEIDFRGDEQSPMVVVVSEPEPDTNLAVRLTYSRFFLSGTPFKVIGNADVKVVVGGTTYTGVFNDSAYIFPYSPVEGDSIALTVRMQNGGDDTVVTASTRMPFRPSVTSKEAVGNAFHFVINDRPTEHNYYCLRLRAVDTTYEYYDADGNYVYRDDPSAVRCDTVLYTYWAQFSCSDAALTSNVSSSIMIDGEETYDRLIFTDQLFDGQNRDVTIKSSGYGPYYYEEYKAKELDSQTYTLVLESLSREAYYYELSRYMQENSDIFMTEPVQLQCNPLGGLGIFGAKATSIVPLGTVTNQQ